jgi:hypothetical protein
MNIVRKFLGPRSKYDKTIPYTYMAKTPVIEGDDELFAYYFADTICGLIEYLDEHKIEPHAVELFGVYLKKEIPLETEACTKDGKWLQRPLICISLEERFKATMETCYKGHVANSACSFVDRDTKGSGPY